MFVKTIFLLPGKWFFICKNVHFLHAHTRNSPFFDTLKTDIYHLLKYLFVTY